MSIQRGGVAGIIIALQLGLREHGEPNKPLPTRLVLKLVKARKAETFAETLSQGVDHSRHISLARRVMEVSLQPSPM